MLKALKELLDAFAAPAAPNPQDEAHALQLATAVLLVEVMRADPELAEPERDAVLQGLRDKFGLPDDELERLLELAHATAEDNYDYHRFTSILNERFTQPQKIQIVENMWRVAYADSHLDTHELHLISKIAGLLHVTHGEYIAAKLHAKQAARLQS